MVGAHKRPHVKIFIAVESLYPETANPKMLFRAYYRLIIDRLIHINNILRERFYELTKLYLSVCPELLRVEFSVMTKYSLYVTDNFGGVTSTT